MRVSVVRSDPGYRERAYRCKVFLNGEEFKRAITADEELGEIIAYVERSDGNGFVVDDSGKKFKTERIFGKVEIKC